MTRFLEIEAVSKAFAVSGGRVLRAVEEVSLGLDEGTTLGIVGESGCGKTTLARMVLGLSAPSSGRIRYLGSELAGERGRADRAARRTMQAVFQDPLASLNPRMRVSSIVGEPLYNLGWSRARIRERVDEVLEVVGLGPDCLERYPHAFSGGQRQRIGIARALAPSPRLVVCDEAVSALDVSIQAQILNLLKDIQARFGVAYLFISHNLAVVRHLSTRVAVMYLGRVVEEASEADLFERPLHPYTRALMAAVPEPGTAQGLAPALEGEPPNPYDQPGGCPFHTRCPLASAVCRDSIPAFEEKQPGHRVSCHLVEPMKRTA